MIFFRRPFADANLRQAYIRKNMAIFFKSPPADTNMRWHMP